MTRDDVMRMAREVADPDTVDPVQGNDPVFIVATPEEMIRFAQLAQAQEREACAWLCEDLERHKWETLKNGGPLKGFSAMDCARAIRARGQA